MKLLVIYGVLVLAIGACCGVSMHNPFFCYMTDPIRPMTTIFLTTGSYEAHRRRFNITTVNPFISTCTPSRFWYLGRYGGRYPFPGAFERMLNFANSSVQADIVSNYEAGRTTLCREDFDAIRDWVTPANFSDIEKANFATPTGILAMTNIAKRFQQVFPQLLTETYSPERFLFRHTLDERTNTSIRAFASGLFGESGSQNVVYEDVPENDWFLRPIDFCPEMPTEYNEEDAFRAGPEVEEMVEEVNRKLGFRSSNQLDIWEIYDMHNWCAIETTATFEFSESETGEDAAWCSAFNAVNHHSLIEYTEDLYYFYTTGYGVRNQRLMQNLHCGLMQDLLNHMQSDDGQAVRVYVTYVRQILGMLVTLGSFRDTWPIHQHNYAQQLLRDWNKSLMTPFGANIAVIRYDCDDDDDDLLFLLNERPLRIPGCDQETGVCKLSAFVNRFERFVGANCEQLFCSSD